MNRRWMCAACLILATSVVVGTVRGQGAAVDREGIGHLLSALRAAWDRHDADALAALWAPTGDYVNATGVVAEGQAEVLRLFDDEQTALVDRRIRTGLAEISGGFSLLEIVLACFDWAAHMAIAPGKQWQVREGLLRLLFELGV